jgi:hypothetical protein
MELIEEALDGELVDVADQRDLGIRKHLRRRGRRCGFVARHGGLLT